jgi:hypothetical protein
MANTKFDCPWALEEAVALIQVISPGLMSQGFAVGLTGSVLTKGSSQHDLDIIIYPMRSTIRTHWEEARLALMGAGFSCLIPADEVRRAWSRKGSDDQKNVEVWLFNKRRVDVFFLR